MYLGSRSHVPQSSTELLKCVNLLDEEIPIAPGHVGVYAVDHVLIVVEVNQQRLSGIRRLGAEMPLSQKPRSSFCV